MLIDIHAIFFSRVKTWWQSGHADTKASVVILSTLYFGYINGQDAEPSASGA
jgi:hypothetical protein